MKTSRVHAGAAAFEPGVVAAIDLDELAQAGSAVARLVHLGRSLAARPPQARDGHQPSDRLQTEFDAVALDQLLARQRWSEVAVAIPDQLDRALCQARRQLMVARLASLTRGEARSAFLPVPNQQPPELARRDADPLGRGAHAEHSVYNGLHDLQPIRLAHAHRDRRRRSRRHSQPSTWAGHSATSLLGANATLLLGAYTTIFDMRRYVDWCADPGHARFGAEWLLELRRVHAARDK